MRSLVLVVALVMFTAMSAIAAEARFYIGTYTGRTGSKGIYTATLDTETGKLGAVTLAAAADNPGYVALTPEGKFLYAVEDSGSNSAVAAFHVGQDGALTLLNQIPAAGACHVWCDNTGHNVLTAAYGDGSIACYQTLPDGSLGVRTAFIKYTGSGPDPKRQKQPYAHSIYTDGDNHYVYACDLGTDHVWIFKFDPGHGTLTPNDPPAAMVPPGGGPRHLAISTYGKFVYVNSEMGLSVTVFARDPVSGTLTPIQTVSTLPPGASREGVTTAEIFCHPSGKWLYVSNRGADSIASYSIGSDGKLTFIETVPAQVEMPRGFGIDPSGKWLVAAGQKDNKIAVLKIDQSTGRLTATDQTAEVSSPVCILFARQVKGLLKNLYIAQ